MSLFSGVSNSETQQTLYQQESIQQPQRNVQSSSLSAAQFPLEVISTLARREGFSTSSRHRSYNTLSSKLIKKQMTEEQILKYLIKAVLIFGKVTGYRPEAAQTLLFHTFSNLNPKDRSFIQHAFLTSRLEEIQKAAALMTYYALKNFYAGLEPQLVDRDRIFTVPVQLRYSEIVCDRISLFLESDSRPLFLESDPREEILRKSTFPPASDLVFTDLPSFSDSRGTNINIPQPIVFISDASDDFDSRNFDHRELIARLHRPDPTHLESSDLVFNDLPSFSDSTGSDIPLPIIFNLDPSDDFDSRNFDRRELIARSHRPDPTHLESDVD